jgi:formylglycine-generating enzyme required for sulfatase activity
VARSAAIGAWLAAGACALVACFADLSGFSGGADAPDGGGDAAPAVLSTANAQCHSATPGTKSDCGPDGGGTSCCAAIPVAGGTFLRSNDAGASATISGFDLDKYEVTVGRFRAFLTAGGGTQALPPAEGSGANPRLADTGWKKEYDVGLAVDTDTLRARLTSGCKDVTLATWTDTPADHETMPINCVDWFTAFAFCIWDGGRLATEAEWNFAAAGGAEQRVYPWSVPPDDTTIDPTYAAYGCLSKDAGCSLDDVPSVGSRSPKGDGRFGHADLAGSMNEWVLDWYGSYPLSCVDCANLGVASDRTERGDDFMHSQFTKTAGRDHDVPETLYPGKGIRCAR